MKANLPSLKAIVNSLPCLYAGDRFLMPAPTGMSRGLRQRVTRGRRALGLARNNRLAISAARPAVRAAGDGLGFQDAKDREICRALAGQDY